MDVIALPLQGSCIYFIPVPRATASPLPWADMLRPFRPFKMYKLQGAGLKPAPAFAFYRESVTQSLGFPEVAIGLSGSTLTHQFVDMEDEIGGDAGNARITRSFIKWPV